VGWLKVNIEIGELVLHGTDKATAKRVGRAIEIELARLIQNEGLPNGLQHQNQEIASLDAGTLALTHGSTDSTLMGVGIARSVYNTLGDTK
jgi:hypothetical protein